MSRGLISALRFLAAFSGTCLLLFLSLPPGPFGPLVLVALVPLLVALHETRWLLGLASGPSVMFVVGAIYEVGLVGPVLEDPLPGAGLMLCVLFGCTLGIPLAMAAGGRWSLRQVLVVSAGAVGAEGLLLLLVPGHLALALARQPLALGVAAMGSIWAVTFLIWWVNMSLAAWIVSRERRYGIAAAAVLPVAGLAWCVARIGAPSEAGPAAEIAAVQADTTTTYDDWVTLHLRASAAREGAAQDGAGPAMVVWPELSAVKIVSDGGTESLSRLARAPGAAPFVTTFRTPGPKLPYNTAAIFSPSGESEHYLKRHPYADERFIHAPGTDAVTVSCDGINYGLTICFDSCFPAAMRATARARSDAAARPDVILLPTLDPPDHTGLIQAMHAASTPFRAVETGCPIVRADITANSMIVGPRGDILAEAGVGEAVIRGRVPLASGSWQPAMYVGDGVLYACVLIVVASGVASLVGRPPRSE